MALEVSLEVDVSQDGQTIYHRAKVCKNRKGNSWATSCLGSVFDNHGVLPAHTAKIQWQIIGQH